MNWRNFEKHLLDSGFSQKDRAFLEKVFEFASKIHEGEKRLSGDDYIVHPIAVAIKIMNLKLDAATVAAGLLHDVVEKDPQAQKEIRKKFGEEVAFLVDSVTKVDRVHATGTDRAMESVKKMFLAVAQDIRVVIVKLMDRLHNMETLSYQKKEKQDRIAKETLSLYASLADRLGMWNVKAKLEDLSMRYVYPQEYEKITTEVKKRLPERERFLKKLVPILKVELEKEKIPLSDISYREKHIYSIWKKLEQNEGDWSRLFDLLAVRIIVPDIKNCYGALGVIHKLWKPIPGRFKDYIALPKPNGYQSLHTSVFAEDGVVVEFQIRTEEMHKEAESGIAAHWAYSEAGKPKQGFKAIGKKFNWIGQLAQWEKDLEKSNSSSEEMLESLKIDFFRDRIFVLTPKGDVIDLPQGATPLDFAYHIHSEIGNKASGAKVNEKLVSLSRELNSGDVIEIMTQKNKKPSIEWLSMVKTSMAKNFIRRELKISGSKSFLSLNSYPVDLKIYGKNRIGFIKDITAVFSRLRINIQSLNADRSGNEAAPIKINFLSKGEEQIKKLTEVLKKVEGVTRVESKVK
ncbi:bifunctional (p)ppGpp synthetase/guanosine-3',5'-bis(diphosphate) 3'-pyrophosphohydrolase [Candidatus Giovannonibacteria bacterium]|nr:bifunctional (p)ppGpp synthetase/guanosine-3',5'-bis(diphosphate) 3'-pyrophosphohydrolase [Candidatus Giovannonibacteria bacterium]